MNSKLLIQRAISMCLTVAIIAAYSMVTLANSERIAGELSISGKNINGEALFVRVNGEEAQTGRSIFSSSTIATPENVSAVVNVGKVGKIELAPNTVLALSFDEKGISGDLSAGRVTVLNASGKVNIKTLDGTNVELNAGDSATSNAGKTQKDDDDTTSGGGGHGALFFALVLGGAAVGLIIAATTNNNRVALGGASTVVSPTR